ncbi:MAG TPA: PAS domain S-box protein, partial [Anaerolineaceae bacterium]|nr:PAS domain S-box protein [Anaerolineaceae bacterium]
MMNNRKNLNAQKDHLLKMLAQLVKKIETDEVERPDVLEQQVESWLKGEAGQPAGGEADEIHRVLDELPAMIWQAGVDRQCSYVNPAWQAFTGRTLAQAAGSGWEKGVHPDDRRRRRQVIARAIRGQQPFRLEYRLRHYTGDYRWVRDYGRPFTDAAGSFAGYIGISIDLTELKQKDRALNESEARFEALFDFDPDAVLVVGPRGSIQLANRQAVNMFGYSLNELYGQPVEMLMPPDFRRRHEKHLQGYMRAPRVRPMGAHLDLVAQRKDGSLFPVDITLGPLDSEEGPVVLATIRDITERKRMEAELSEVNRRLIDSAEVERLQLAQELHDGPLQDLYSVTYQLSELQSKIAS